MWGPALGRVRVQARGPAPVLGRALALVRVRGLVQVRALAQGLVQARDWVSALASGSVGAQALARAPHRVQVRAQRVRAPMVQVVGCPHLRRRKQPAKPLSTPATRHGPLRRSSSCQKSAFGLPRRIFVRSLCRLFGPIHMPQADCAARIAAWLVAAYGIFLRPWAAMGTYGRSTEK